jgi:hypothetical protein
MEPVSAAIVGALVAGAVASLKGVASEAVTDAYKGLRTLIVDRYKRAGAVAAVEEDPTSEAGKAVLAEAVTKSGAAADAEVQRRAEELSRALDALPGEAKAGLDIDLSNIEAGRTILLEQLAANRIKVAGAKAGEDFILRNAKPGVAGPQR